MTFVTFPGQDRATFCRESPRVATPRPFPPRLVVLRRARPCLRRRARLGRCLHQRIHYDDATSSGDTGERIEVVATAGETLSAYRIYLYNGSTPSAAVTYDNDLVPAGSLVSCGAQVRIATVSYASNGIQNGQTTASPWSMAPARSCSSSATKA
jgi:hypothetical protein